MSSPPYKTPRLKRPRRKKQPAPWDTKPKVGDKLGSFRLLEVLGEGGAGAVYRAEHDFLKRPVAIKVLHPELSARPHMVARFFQEALAVNRARHPNIIDITDVVASETSPPYIVMELLVGEDLADFIDKYAPVGVSEAVPILAQICDALAVVHSLDIVHRDLKPENIFLARRPGDPDGPPVVKLLDFGIAKFLHSDENRRRTWSGGVLGTPAYMPLEQLHGLPVDHRADIYALGVVTYELLTGRLPFEIDSMEDLSNQRLTLEPPPPSQRPIHHPPEPITPAIDEVVLRALNDDPGRRFQSVQDFRAALLAACESEAVSSQDSPQDGSGETAGQSRSAQESGQENAGAAAALPALPPHPEAAARQRPRSRLRLLGALAGALLLLGAIGWLWTSRRSLPQPPSASPSPRASAPLTRQPQPPPRPVPIRILSHPDHARIHAGDSGAFLGQTPTTVPVPAGRARVLQLRLEGHRPARITVTADGPNPVQVWLVPLSERPRSPARPDAKPRVIVRVLRLLPPPRHRTQPRRPGRTVSDQGIVDPFRQPPMRQTP